jgi:hypothetical protein
MIITALWNERITNIDINILQGIAATPTLDAATKTHSPQCFVKI